MLSPCLFNLSSRHGRQFRKETKEKAERTATGMPDSSTEETIGGSVETFSMSLSVLSFTDSVMASCRSV